MPAVLLVGSITRDRIMVPGRRWSQPGGAPWHAGVALAPAVEVTAVAQAGPWCQRFALPGLRAAGVRWLGTAAPCDTTFINRYARRQRRQVLCSQAPPIGVAQVPTGAITGMIAGAVVSPLFPADVDAAVMAALRPRGIFVALDLQGLLRSPDARGRVRTVAADISPFAEGAHALKCSQRELQTLLPVLDWRAAAIDLARSLGCELVVTRGAEGAFMVAGTARIEVEGVTLDATVDTTGAGDALIAAYTAGRGSGLSAGSALTEATAVTVGLLRRRAAAVAAGAELPRLWRRWEAITAVPRHVAVDMALEEALRRHLPAAPGGEVDAAELLSACWALWTRGWPSEAALAPAAVAAALASAATAAANDRAEPATLPPC